MPLLVAPIGSCRVATPVKSVAARWGWKVDRRVYGLTHSISEAIQQARWIRGELDVPEELWPLVSARRPSARPRPEQQPPDLWAVEIAELRAIRYGGLFLKLAAVRKAYAEAPQALRLLLRHPGERRKALRQAELAQSPDFAALPPLLQDILREATLPEQTEASLRADLAELRRATGEGLLVVTNVNAVDPEKRPLEKRARGVAMLAEACADLGIPCFDPTELMARHGGQEICMKERGLDHAHYTDEFGLKVGDAIAARLSGLAEDAPPPPALTGWRAALARLGFAPRPAAPRAPRPTYSATRDRLREAEATGDWQAALDVARAAPPSREASLAVARNNLRLRRLDDALAALPERLADDPQTAMSLGEAEMAKGRPLMAAALALAVRIPDAPILSLRARALAGCLQEAKAAARLDDAAGERFCLDMARFGFGPAWAAAAAAHLRAALSAARAERGLGLTDGPALDRLRALAPLADFAQAQAAAPLLDPNAVIAPPPPRRSAAALAAQALYRDQKWRDALDALTAVSQAEPKDAANWLLLSRTLWHLGQKPESRQAAAQAHALAPDHAPTQAWWRRIGGDAITPPTTP